MERLTAVETNAVYGALVARVFEAWDDAVQCYELGLDDAGNYWANIVQNAGSAYRKLLDWPDEPEQASGCACDRCNGLGMSTYGHAEHESDYDRPTPKEFARAVASTHYMRLPCGCPIDPGCNGYHSI
jgi:hypothetical protein